MAYSIPLFDLNYDEAENQAVLGVLNSRWISMGEQTALLEERFAGRIKVPHAVAVSSCTAALHLAMILAGIGPGDEVIVPSLTFVATANAVRYVGATAVFADIVGPDTLTLDPFSVLEKITGRTKAVVVMHYGGFACDMDAFSKIAREHNLLLIEDAAHAPASSYHGKALGSIGHMGCFSFFSNKNLSCAEGGMLVTSNPDYAARARLLRSHGMTTLSFERASGHATEYDVVDLGYNYRMDDIRASLVLAQLEKLEQDIRARERVRDEYISRLNAIDELCIPFVNSTEPISHYIFPLVLKEGGSEKRDRVRKSLADDGIQTSVHYPAVHRFSIYEKSDSHLPQTEWATDHEITLPMYAALRSEQIDYITDCLKKALS